METCGRDTITRRGRRKSSGLGSQIPCEVGGDRLGEVTTVKRFKKKLSRSYNFARLTRQALDDLYGEVDGAYGASKKKQPDCEKRQ